jgi:hypothetical protein
VVGGTRGRTREGGELVILGSSPGDDTFVNPDASAKPQQNHNILISIPDQSLPGSLSSPVVNPKLLGRSGETMFFVMDFYVVSLLPTQPR